MREKMEGEGRTIASDPRRWRPQSANGYGGAVEAHFEDGQPTGMKREALEKMNRQASEMPAQGTPGLCTAHTAIAYSCTVRAQSGSKTVVKIRSNVGKCFRMSKAVHVGA